MYSSSLLVLALAVFGASAQTLVSSGCNGGLLGGVSGINGGLIGGVSGINGGLLGGVSGINGGILGGLTNVGTTVASTPVLESVPLRLPSIIHPTSVQESCNCIKTVVRPTLRKEVFTIPSVQRFLHTTSTPVVETVPYVSGSSVDLPTGGVVGGVLPGSESGSVIGSGFSGISSGIVSGGLVSGVNSGFGGLTGVVSGINSGFGSSC